MTIASVERGEQEVTLLLEPDVEYVSLVKRGSNQRPWRIVKSQEHNREEVAVGDISEERRVIHSLVVPEGTDTEAIKAVAGEAADNLDFTNSVKAGGWVRSAEWPR